MSATLHDSPFTGSDGTAVPSLTPAVGVALSQTASAFKVRSNRAYYEGADSAVEYLTTNETLPADYSLFVTFRRLGTDFCLLIPAVRLIAPNNFYGIQVDADTSGGTLTLFKVISGTVTIFQQVSGVTITTGVNYSVELRIAGTTIRGFFEGTEVFTPVTDSNLSAPASAAVGSGVFGAAATSANGFDVDRLVVVGPQTLDWSQQPSDAWDGQVIRPSIKVRRTTNGTTTDTAFTGTLTVSVATGTGALIGTAARAAVAGEAVFDDAGINGNGEHMLQVSTTGHDPVASNAFKVATGTGIPGDVTVIFSENNMSRLIKKGETVAGKKRIPLTLRTSANEPTSVSMSGRKAMLSANVGMETASTNDIVQTASSTGGYIELTDVEANAFNAGDVVQARVVGVTGLMEGFGYAEITIDDPFAASLTLVDIGAAVATALFATLVERGMTLMGWLRAKGAVLSGKTTGANTNTEVFKGDRNDGTPGKTRVTVTNTGAGTDRATVTYDLTDD